MSTDNNTPPVRITVAAELQGWPVDLAFDMPPAGLGKALERLQQLGYTPRRETPPAAPAPALASAGPPCCPVHGPSKVREGKRGLFCAAKRADGEYCTEKPI